MLNPQANYQQKVHTSFSQQQVMATIGAILTRVEPGFVEIQLPYKNELTQQDGYIHAGIIGTIADSAGGYAAFTLMEEGASVLSIEYKLNLLAPAKGELFIAKAKVLKAGRTITVCQSDIFSKQGDDEKLCATATITLIAVHQK